MTWVARSPMRPLLRVALLLTPSSFAAGCRDDSTEGTGGDVWYASKAAAETLAVQSSAASRMLVSGVVVGTTPAAESSSTMRSQNAFTSSMLAVRGAGGRAARMRAP